MHDLKRGLSHLLLGAAIFVGAIVPALGARDMQKTFNELTSAEKTAAKRAAKKTYEERYQWVLFPAFLLLVIEACLSERRRRAAVVVAP